jgi:ferredoxin-type protein NapH
VVSAGPWTRGRRAVQALSALLWLVLPLLAEPRLSGDAAALRVGPLDLVEPAGALSALLAAGALPAALALGVLPLLVLALALGPVACAWACPYGLLSEGIDAARWRGARWPASGGAAARRPRLAALAALLALSALVGAPLAADLSPPRLLSALPLEAWSSRGVPAVTAALLALLLALELLAPRRLVCRVLCPARALALLLRRPFTWGPRFTQAACRCPEVPACAQACPWGLDPRDAAQRDAGCTSCMACVDRCPAGALVALRRR